VQVTNAGSVCDLQGLSLNSGGSAGEGLGGGIEHYTDGKNVNGINISAGPSARTPTPFELHSVVENTWVTTLNSAWHSLENAFAGADNAVRNALTGFGH
jgi:hypothetical protein